MSQQRRCSGELPDTFRHYRVHRLLGSGSMGDVYLVDNYALDRQEALKVPHQDSGDYPEQVGARFRREARAAARLEHPNICPIYHVGVHDGIHFFTMRYLEGELLSKSCSQPWPPREAVAVVVKLAQALEYAHGKGVIHRDLKPGNVMMCPGVGPVVMDFGLAKRVVATNQNLTETGTILGTPAYMAPEQLRGDNRRIGPASDVYSLGVILFELLTGHTPFRAAAVADMLVQILTSATPAPSQFHSEVSPALDEICGKAMAKEPELRYPSMKEFAADLVEYLRGRPAESKQRYESMRAFTEDLGEYLVPPPLPPGPDHQTAPEPMQAETPLHMTGPAAVRPVVAWQADAGQAPRHSAGVPDPVKQPWQRAAAAQGRRTSPGMAVAVVVSFAITLSVASGLVLLAYFEELAASRREEAALRHRDEAGTELDRVVKEPAEARADGDRVTRERIPIGLLRTFKGSKGDILAVGMTLDGRVLAFNSNHDLLIWDAETGKVLVEREVKTIEGIAKAALSRDGSQLSVCNGIALAVHDIASGKEVARFSWRKWPLASPQGLAFSADQRRILVSDLHQGVLVFDVTARGDLLDLPANRRRRARTHCATFSPDGKTVALGTEEGIEVWDVETKKEIKGPRASRKLISCLAYSLDGERILAGAGSGNPQHPVAVYNTRSRKEIQVLEGHRNSVNAVACTPDGQFAVSADFNGVLCVWSLRTGKSVGQFAAFRGGEASPSCLAVSSDGRFAVTVAAGQVQLWRLPSPTNSAVGRP